jgi:hypothetical protein
MASPLAMILMSHRSPEKCHDPITGELVDGTFIPVNLSHQDFKTSIHDAVDFFRVEFFRN